MLESMKYREAVKKVERTRLPQEDGGYRPLSDAARNTALRLLRHLDENNVAFPHMIMASVPSGISIDWYKVEPAHLIHLEILKNGQGHATASEVRPSNEVVVFGESTDGDSPVRLERFLDISQVYATLDAWVRAEF